MNIKYFVEKPSDSDKFKGGSHDKVATSIADVLNNCSEIHLIGLEGELGSGKSTILELLQKRMDIRKKYKCITFDLDMYHHSSLKKSFVVFMAEKFSAGMSKRIQENIEKTKDKAIGNILSYKKKSKSEMSGWLVLFVIALVFWATALRFSIPVFNEMLLKGSLEAAWQNIATLIFLLAPILIFMFWALGRLCSKKTPYLGDLINRNTTDTITEKMLITREVGSLELRNAMVEFIGWLPSEMKVLLIVDNIDRVPSEKVREMWSDLEILTNVAGDSLKIILPYSRKHVAEALSGDNKQEGVEFIFKRIPVSFRVPPIVSAGWREVFKDLCLSAGLDVCDKQIQICATLIDIWLPDRYKGHVTPRFLKRYINDILMLRETTPEEVSPITIGFYLLSVRYEDIDFKRIIELKTKSSEEQREKEEEKINKKIAQSHKKIQAFFPDQSWSAQLMCVHYLTVSDIAIAEMLDEPLLSALERQDVGSFLENKDVFGFSNAVEKLIETQPVDDVLKLLKSVYEEDNEYGKGLLNSQLGELNNGLSRFLSGSYEHDESLVYSVSYLKNEGIHIEVGEFESIYKRCVEEFNEEEDGDVLMVKLNQIYPYSVLLDKTPKFVSDPIAKLYIDVLWKNKEKWEEWRIEDRLTGPKGIKSLSRQIITRNKDDEDSQLLSHIAKNLKLGSIDFSKNWVSGNNGQLKVYDAFNSGHPTLSVIRLLPFDVRWYSNNLIPLYMAVFNDKGNIQYRKELIAQAVVHMIVLKSWNHITELLSILDEYPEYVNYLNRYLAFVTSFSTLIDALKQEELKPYIKDGIKNLILEDKIEEIDVSSVLTNEYGLLSPIAEDDEGLVTWLGGWIDEDSLSELTIDELDNTFVGHALEHLDILGAGVENAFKKVFTDSEDELFGLIVDNDKNLLAIAKYANEKDWGPVEGDCIRNVINKCFEMNCSQFSEDADRTEIFSQLLKLLPESISSQIKTSHRNKLYQKSTQEECKKAIIINIGEFISLDLAEDEAEQKAVVDLFNEVGVSLFVADWLNKQTYDFAKWSESNLQDLANYISTAPAECFQALRKEHDLNDLLVAIERKNEDDREEGES